MNPTTAGPPGQPLPQPLQHPRSAGLINHQHHPQSPHHSHRPQATSQASYISPHSSTHSLPQHQSPYVGSVAGISPQHPGDPSFFGAHPSPYSANSAAGSYAPSEPNDAMATQAAAIGRQPYPPISSYQTPQSNSPASIHSPQTDAHGRPIYGMPPPIAQHVYYPQYAIPGQSPYSQHPSASHNPQMAPVPGMLMSHQQQQPAPPPPPQQQQQQSAPQVPQVPQQQPPPPQQPQHPQHQPHQPSHSQPGMIDTKPSQPSLQRPPSNMAAPQSTPSTPSGPAPGPIPATTPLVVRQDNNGVQWIAFEYSRDRVKMEYTIRCDVESVNIEELSAEFKANNCVYPRACCGKDQYKGNRLHYESECNAVGWALAQLNPNLREKRGLIQRAVDSWRNSNQDVRLRSRRVRRMAKMHNRKTQMTPPGLLPGGQGPPPSAAGLPPQAANGYNPNGGPAHHHLPPPPHAQPDLTLPASSASARYAQSFYPQYPPPPNPNVGGASMPSVHDVMDPMHSQASTLATPANASSSGSDEDDETTRRLFGNVPESKRRKFILVDDTQRGTRVRVRVMLDQAKMDDMPDAHLRLNAVYPRSYYPRQMCSSPEPAGGRREWDDDEDDDDELDGVSGTAPTQGKTMVSVPLLDGSEAQLPVPRMTKSRRAHEVALNELGYRMAWGQARTFSGRTLFLQRSLDAYRNKMHSTMVATGQDVASIAPHFETRPGKRRWLERKSRAKRAESP